MGVGRSRDGVEEKSLFGRWRRERGRERGEGAKGKLDYVGVSCKWLFWRETTGEEGTERSDVPEICFVAGIQYLYRDSHQMVQMVQM